MAIQQLTLTQNEVAQQIVAAGRYMGATDAEIVGALSAAWAESRLNPNAVGDNGKAVGIFQQHPHYGSVEARRDPLTAARQFFTNLFGTRPSGEPIAERVADVQRPAAQYRGIYGDSLDEAYTIFTQVNSEVAPSGQGSDMERNLLLRTWRDIDDWLEDLGLRVGPPTVGQTSGGSHAAGSYHYDGIARDYGASSSDADRIAQALVPLAIGPNRQIDELYYAPLGIFYDNGVPLSNPSKSLVDGHQDHVHVALSKSGNGGAVNLGSLKNVSTSNGAVQTTGGSVLKTLDSVLNDSGGVLDPIGTGKIVVARGAIVIGGLICVTFGFILVVTSIGKPAVKAAGVIANPVGAIADAAS